MNKTILSIYFLLVLSYGIAVCQVDHGKKNMAFNLSQADIKYVYNRAFDIALRDNMSGLESRSLFFVPYEQFDTILITIDTDLSRRAFYTEVVDSLNWVRFQDSLDVEEQFKEVRIVNSFRIENRHYHKTPVLEGNHLMHVTFSDIYTYEGYYYLGVLLEQQIEKGANINYPDWVLFKFELCNEKFILFRKMYHPVGSDGIKNYSYTRDLEDRECY